MKIIDAIWEKRNLGVSTKEINLDVNDTVVELEQIRRLDCEYAVVRVPVSCIDLMFGLERLGYNYIETMLDVQHDHKNIDSCLDSISKRIADSITYFEMDATDLDGLWNEISSGIFNTDRVFLDPAFTPDKSATRYIGWIKDELSRGGKIYKCITKGEPFGFFVCRIDDKNVNHVYHIGMFNETKTTGLGVGLVIASIRQALEAGARISISNLSTNNIPAIRANLAAGYRITSARYIYIKHNNK